MSNLKEECNSEPIYYCEYCLSLAIKTTSNIDFCDDCGSTDIASTSIEEWEKLYESKYNNNFLKGDNNGAE